MEAQTPIAVTCPDCGGPLLETQGEGLRQYRCIVGHAYSARTVLEAHSEAQENALWAAVVALEEAANLVERVAPQLPPSLAERIRRQAAQKLRQAAEIRKIVEELEPFSVE
jgi:two-component system, chemotaxis family, protein-glutamate methylesterase/glutaminase